MELKALFFLSTYEARLVKDPCVSAPPHAAPSSSSSPSRRYTELFDSDTGCLSLPQGCGWKLGSWCGSVRSRMMSEGWVLVEDGEAVVCVWVSSEGIGD